MYRIGSIVFCREGSNEYFGKIIEINSEGKSCMIELMGTPPECIGWNRSVLNDKKYWYVDFDLIKKVKDCFVMETE